MFKVKQYNKCGQFVKPHYASTRKIAEEIITDLSARFSGTFELNEEPTIDYCWDPGGMLVLDDEEFQFLLKNITIVCRAQHFNYFIDYIQSYKARGTRTKYIKIHSDLFCVCITLDEFEKLKLLVTNPDFMLKAEQSWKRREDKMNKLADAGHIQRVVKDAVGNIYKVPKDKFISDKNLLN